MFVDVRQQLLKHFHGLAIQGHSGVLATTRRFVRVVYQKLLQKDGSLFGSVAPANFTSKKILLHPTYYNHCIFQKGFSWIFLQIQWKVFRGLMERLLFWWQWIASPNTNTSSSFNILTRPIWSLRYFQTLSIRVSLDCGIGIGMK